MIHERIPFEEAITEKLLLKNRFQTLSKPQQVALKAFYGLQLTDAELDYWAILQGSCEYDDLGYVTSVTRIPYNPKEYNQFWALLGRRSGKTDKLTSTVFAYETILGGHSAHVEPKQEFYSVIVAQKLDVAQSHLAFVKNAIDSSPILRKQITNDLAQSIELKNGMKIIPASPSIKAQRGWAIPIIDMDEVGFWYTDPSAVNPDFEVERALSWAQAQFPNYKRFGTTTPYTKEGLAWKYYNAGTEGINIRCVGCEHEGFCPTTKQEREEYQDILLLHSSTAAIENPRINKTFLEREYARDPEAFEREALARFVDSISGFFNSNLLKIATEGAPTERLPITLSMRDKNPQLTIPHYVAAIDPAFRNDSFAFTIVHLDLNQGIVQDYVQRFTPIPGIPLNPSDVLNNIIPTLYKYGIKTIYSDQYQLESMQELARARGIHIECVQFTGSSKARIFGTLRNLVNQQKLKLLNHEETLKELLFLEKHLTRQGAVQITAPPGKHDDMATVLALAAYKAVQMRPAIPQPVKAPPTLFQQGMASIKRRKQLQQKAFDDF